jgi:hypothetical protein
MKLAITIGVLALRATAKYQWVEYWAEKSVVMWNVVGGAFNIDDLTITTKGEFKKAWVSPVPYNGTRLYSAHEPDGTMARQRAIVKLSFTKPGQLLAGDRLSISCFSVLNKDALTAGDTGFAFTVLIYAGGQEI